VQRISRPCPAEAALRVSELGAAIRVSREQRGSQSVSDAPRRVWPVKQQEECVQFKSSTKAALAAAALMAFSPAAALAQDEVNNSAGDTQYAAPQQDDDDEFPLGLLGLLGLAGLLGLKKRERDIHVDARHNH
jgi:MYXO-CTERM domain-containing protein